jgi:DNA-binding PadR family transcriptional regulator
VRSQTRTLVDKRHISAYKYPVRRKPGALLPLEQAICLTAAALRRKGVDEFHGYQLASHLAEDAERRLLTAYGTLYRALGRLEDMGLLESRREDPEIAARESRPGRRLYRLTPAGQAAVAAIRAAQRSTARPRHRTRTVPA